MNSKEKGILFGVIAAIVIIGAFLVGTMYYDNNGNETGGGGTVTEESTGPTTLVDESTNIEGGHYITMSLESGTYGIDIDSDDDLVISIIGGGVGDWVDADGVKSYHRDITLSESGTLKIANPSGVLSNPTATVQIKIVKE